MLLNLINFHLIGLSAHFVGLQVLFGGKVDFFLGSDFATIFGKGEGMILIQNIVPWFHSFQIVSFSEFTQGFIGSCFIILHIDIPGIGELDELLTLHSFYLIKLQSLSFLHFPQLSFHFNFGYLFKFFSSLITFHVSILALHFLIVILKCP